MTTKANVEKFLGASITGEIDLFIDSASQHIKLVTGQDFDTVPDDVAMAATILAAGMYSATRKEGAIKEEQIGNNTYRVSYGDDWQWSQYERAITILDQYKLYSL